MIRTDSTTYTPSPGFDANPEAPYTWGDLLALAKHWHCADPREDGNGNVWVVDGTPGEVLIATRDEAARV
jgi:hypothetical protein